MTARPYDVVLLGATGFTGRLAAAHLRTHAPAGLRLAFAGRDRARLEQLAADVGGGVEVATVDVHDAAAVDALAGRCRVLATTVGPYARHGRLVVAACAKAGTHYVDLSGEPGFVGDVVLRHDATARRSGATLISSCGFESAVADMAVARAVETLAPADDAAVTVRTYLQGTGAVSGGTIASALDSVARGVSGAQRGYAPGPRTVRVDRAGVHTPTAVGGKALPLPTVDRDVVLRTAAQRDGYGQRCTYGHYARLSGLPQVLGAAAALSALVALVRFGPTRALLRTLALKPGEGPPPERRATHWFRVTAVAEAAGTSALATVSGGDGGYDDTAVILAETALALAAGEAATAGAVTPMLALPGLADRLAPHGILCTDG